LGAASNGSRGCVRTWLEEGSFEGNNRIIIGWKLGQWQFDGTNNDTPQNELDEQDGTDVIVSSHKC
jgi:hypothetical protein